VIRYNINVAPVDNQRFAITSHLSPTGIAVELRNKSSEVIEVAWDQSVYIDEDGNSSRLIRGGVNLSEKDRPQPSTVIPPGTKVQETVFPVSRIEQQEGQLSQRPIIPAEAWIIGDQKRLQELRADRLRRMYLPGDKELAGKSVRLFLRLLVGDKKENVTLTFDIAGMAQ
jgi:hypothetical protein